MSTALKQTSDWKKYLREMLVTGRAGDSYPRIQHALNVDETAILLVASAIQMYADDDSIVVGTRTTAAGHVHQVNQVWFTKGRRSFAVVYANGRIEIRNRNRSGAPVMAIDKHTSRDKIVSIFANL